MVALPADAAEVNMSLCVCMVHHMPYMVLLIKWSTYQIR